MSINKVDQSSITNALVQSTHATTGGLEQNIEQIFNLQLQPFVTDEFLTTPEGSFLERFVIEELLPKEFKFDEKQESFIKELFQKWSLNNGLCLLDLLGVDIYQSIHLMKSTLTQDTRSEFCHCIYYVYLYLKRHKDGYPPLEKKLDDQYYKGVNWIVLSLDKIKRQMNEARDNKLNQIFDNRKINHETKAILKSKVLAQFNEFNQSIELLKFIIKLKFCSTLLLDNNLISFKGSRVLKKDPQSTMSHLKIYKDYANSLYQTALTKRLCMVTGLELNFLNLDLPRKQLPELIDSCKEQKRLLASLLNHFILSYQLAASGELTHDDWLRSNGIRQVTRKDQAEFTEALLSQLLFIQLMGDFINDSQKIIDEIILPGHFNNWPKQDSILMRFWLNFSMVSEDFAHTAPSHEIHHVIRSKLFDEFHDLVSPLELFYKRLNLTSLAVSDEDLKEKMQANYTTGLSSVDSSIDYSKYALSSKLITNSNVNLIPFHNIPIPTLEEMTPIIDSFDERLKGLPQILESLRLKFKTLLPHLPHEQRNIDFFRKCCFEECIRYCRVVFIFNDYRAITDKIFWLEEFPEVLADFIQLEGLDDIFTEKNVEEELKEDLKTFPQIEEQFKELAIKSKDVVEPKRSPKPTSSAQAPKDKDTLIEPFEFKSRNVRKVIKQLTEAGFFLVRQSGSHQIFKRSEHGPQVVVPNHDELKKGTLASIQDQASFALNSTL